MRRIAHLATLTEPDQPPYTRRAFSAVYTRARDWLAGEFRAAGLETAFDEGGNLVGCLPGREPAVGALACGSHTDTVVGGGRFDGIAGVLAGLEVAQRLGESGERLRHDLVVFDFLAEEASDYGPSCLGSRAVAGTLSQAMLDTTKPDGEALHEGLRNMGADPDAIARGRLPIAQRLRGYLELHIEQGPVLEQEGLAIGVVTGIVGIRRMLVTVEGQADHAGTTPMPLRKDALVGAAELVSRAHALASEGYRRHGLVATVGRLQVSPDMPNVVPARVQFTLDTRCMDLAQVEALCADLLVGQQEAFATRGLTLRWENWGDAVPVTFPEQTRRAVAQAAQGLGYSYREMPSGAGHDAMQLAAVCPSGMVFIPCLAGRSHASEEFATPEALEVGTAVLGAALQRLDASL